MRTINSFSDLKKVSQALKEEAKAREEEEKKRRADEFRRRSEANQFAAAMADMGVRRMAQKNIADTRAPKPKPVARLAGIERQEILQASMSDHADPTVFLESEDGRL